MAELDDFSRYARIIPKEHIPALSRDLKKIPDFSWLLGQPHQEIERLQGDLLRDFPTVYLDEKVEARSRNFTVMILNNTCDLPDGRLDFVTAAPVVDFNKYLEFERARRLKAHTQLGETEKARVEDSFSFPSSENSKAARWFYCIWYAQFQRKSTTRLFAPNNAWPRSRKPVFIFFSSNSQLTLRELRARR